MSNKYTQDMTGTGMYVELPDDDPEPERYYDWMLWAFRKERKRIKSVDEMVSKENQETFELLNKNKKK